MANTAPKRKKQCRITSEGKTIDYKDISMIRSYMSDMGQIVPSRITGTRAIKQRELTRHIKIARFLALLPYCDHHDK